MSVAGEPELTGAWFLDRYWCPHQLGKVGYYSFGTLNSVCGRRQCRAFKKRMEAAREGKQNLYRGMAKIKRHPQVLDAIAEFRTVKLELLPEDLELLKTQLPDPVPQTRQWQRIAETLKGLQ